MAYISNWTGVQVDNGVYNSIDGPRFVMSGVIRLDNIGKTNPSISSSQDLLNLYNYIVTEQSLTPDISNKCISIIRVSKYEKNIGDAYPVTIEASEYTENLGYDSQGHSIARVGVTFKIGNYNYKLYTLFDNSLDHSKYQYWTLEKTTTDYIKISDRLLNRIVNELSISDLVSSISKPDMNDLENLFLNSPIIFLDTTSDSGEILNTTGLRISVIGARSYDFSESDITKHRLEALLCYSKKDYSQDHSDINELGSCRIKITYNSTGALNTSFIVNYLPTFGFE